MYEIRLENRSSLIPCQMTIPQTLVTEHRMETSFLFKGYLLRCDFFEGIFEILFSLSSVLVDAEMVGKYTFGFEN